MDAFSAAEEAAWEVRAVDRAVARFRAAAAEKDPNDLPAGRRALLETAGPTATVIRRRQAEAAKNAGSRGHGKPWGPALSGWDADVLAVVAVCTALRANTVSASRCGQTLTMFGRRVAAVLRDQADHDAFMEAQKAAEKTAKAAARDAGLDPNKVREGELRRVFLAAHPAADRKAWAMFAKRVGIARSAPWTDDLRTHVGAVLAEALAEGAPTWFAVAPLGDGPPNRNPLAVVLTELAVERMADTMARAEIARPLLLPMIVEPNPWRYAA